MKTKEEKAQEVAALTDQIGKASNAFLIDFKGISVPQVTELRRQIRGTNAGYVVVKNTLALIALKDSPIVAMKEHFNGPTAVAFTTTDAVVLAKTLSKFAKDVPAMRFKGVMLDGLVVPAEQIQTIANLPSREVLVSKLLFLMQTPIRGLVTVLQANIRNLAVLLGQIEKQKNDGQPAPAAE